MTDEIDTFRELTSNVIDAYLAVASNRLNEVMNVLTSIATVLLVLTVVTGSFGQNWSFIPYGSLPLFWISMVITGFIAVGLVMYFRRRGWLYLAANAASGEDGRGGGRGPRRAKRGACIEQTRFERAAIRC